MKLQQPSQSSLTYHSVLLPVSLAVWYSGSEGTTVGTGETDAVGATVAVAETVFFRASTGSTIILTMESEMLHKMGR